MSVSESSLIAERYRIIELLGHGGMGRVWRARDELLHREVAIKEILPPEGLTPEERAEARKRTLREARATARLSHPNVVRVFDIIQTEDFPWIVMEYVPSRSLDQIIKADGPISPERAAHIGLGVLAALKAAHSVGVMHRDVKPSNVLLTDDERVVLTDFGLATLPDDAAVTRPGVVLGSPAYIAPERARDGTAGPESDLWSLGATLYAAVEGQSPYARSNAMATLVALATEDYPTPQRAGDLRPVITGLLRKNPAERISVKDAERLLLRAGARANGLSGRGAGVAGGLAARLRRATKARSDAAGGDANSADGAVGPADGAGAAGAVRPAAGGVAAGAAVGAVAGAAAAAGRPATPDQDPDDRAPSDQAAADGARVPAQPTGEPADPWASESPTSVLTDSAAGAGAAAAQRGGPAPTTVQPAVDGPEDGPTTVVPAPASSSPATSGPARSGPVTSAPATSTPGTSGSVRPVPPGHTYDPDSEKRRRTSFLVGALALLFIVVLVAIVALKNPGGSDKQKDKAGPAASSAAPGAGPDQSSAPAGTPSQEGPGQTPQPTATTPPADNGGGTNGPIPPPEGWKLYEDPSGFKVGIPNDWNATNERKTTETGVRVYFRDSNGRLLLIESTNQPKSDPVKDWETQERARRSGYSGYQLIGIHTVQTRFPSAADWEFTYNGSSSRLHVINRAVITVPGKQAYGIYWSVPEPQWQDSLDEFDIINKTFQNAPV